MHPFLMLTAIAFLYPTVGKCKAFELLVCHGVDVENGSKICHHFIHLIGINVHVVPLNAVASLPEVATNLPLHHAALELIPWGLIVPTILYTCLGSVVEKLIITNPQGSIPGLEVCPTVVVADHGVVCVCCVYPRRSAAQSRSLMCQRPHCPHSGAGVRISVPDATSALEAADRAIMALCC